MIFIGSLLLICFPLGNGRSLTEKRELPLKETIVPTPKHGSFKAEGGIHGNSKPFIYNQIVISYLCLLNEED